MAQIQSEDRRSSQLLFVALVLVTLVLSAVLIAGFWGDTDPGNEFTKLQTDVSDLETGPGSPTN